MTSQLDELKKEFVDLCNRLERPQPGDTKDMLAALAQSVAAGVKAASRQFKQPTPGNESKLPTAVPTVTAVPIRPGQAPPRPAGQAPGPRAKRDDDDE